MPPLYYAGIGSRKTPPLIQSQMSMWAEELDSLGFTLRSGGAQGADQAFQRGATKMEIYVPWSGFEEQFVNGSTIIDPKNDPAWPMADEMTNRFHPDASRLKRGGRHMMARNAFQVLGKELSTPVEFILCWTPRITTDDNRRIIDVSGGTGQAVRIAAYLNIPVFHLGRQGDAENLRILLQNYPR